MSYWGQARIEVSRHYEEIRRRIARSDSVSALYREMVAEGKIHVQRWAFAKEIRLQSANDPEWVSWHTYKQRPKKANKSTREPPWYRRVNR